MTTLTLNLETIKLLGLSPTSYVLLFLLHNSEDTHDIPSTDYDYNMLVERGYVNSDLSLTDIAKSLFKGKQDYEEMWQEFIKLYPRKIGNRVLHNNKEVCRKKFITYLKQGEDYNSIIQGLQNELDIRHKALFTREFIPAWKNLSTYINNKSWNEYAEESKEDSSITDNDKNII